MKKDGRHLSRDMIIRGVVYLFSGNRLPLPNPHPTLILL